MKRKEWHPYFSSVLKHLLEPKGFKVETQVEVGEMPLKIDVVVIKKGKDADVKSLPLVFQSFTDYNIIEYKSPKDRFRRDDFDRLFAYVLLFKIKEGIQWRRQINVYALISGGIKGIEDYIRRNGHELVRIKEGFYFADFGFNFYLIQLDKLEASPENYKLLLFTSGEKVKELVKGICERGKEILEVDLIELIETGLYLHPEEFREEVKLMPQTLADRPDIIGELADIVGVDIFVQGIGKEKVIRSLGEEDVIRSLGEEKVIRSLGEEKVIRSLGEEKIIRSLGEEKIQKNLIKLLGKEKIKKMLEEN